MAEHLINWKAASSFDRSGFHLSIRISLKTVRALTEGEGRRREKLFLHNKVLFLNSPKTSRQLLYFDLKSEFISCVYVITLCILYVESIPVIFTKFVAVSWSGLKWLRQMTEFTDSITRPDESLAIVNDYARKPNENCFFSVSAKAV